MRAALAWSEETASLGRQHNDANVVAVGARMHTREEATKFVETFLVTPFLRRRAPHPAHRHALVLRDDGRPAPVPAAPPAVQ